MDRRPPLSISDQVLGRGFLRSADAPKTPGRPAFGRSDASSVRAVLEPWELMMCRDVGWAVSRELSQELQIVLAGLIKERGAIPNPINPTDPNSAGTGARVPQPAGDGCHGSGISARLRGLEFFLSSFPNVGRDDTLPVEGSAPTSWNQAMSAKKKGRLLGPNVLCGTVL